MSTSAAPGASSDVPPGKDSTRTSTFTLQIVSPNSEPLSFQDLPITTTIKQLKARIRDELPSKPVDENQRIIYRGRMLAVDTATMLDVFGKEALATQEPQNLHLVLRQTASDVSTSQISAVPAIATPPQAPPTVSNPPLVPQLINRPQSTPLVPTPGMPGMQAQQPLPGFQQMQQPQTLHQIAHMHNVMSQRLQQLQQESQRLHQEMTMLQVRNNPAFFNAQQGPFGQNAIPHQQGLFRMPLTQNMPQHIPQTLQNLINQQQRERAADGRHGAQDSGGNTPHIPQASSGRASPSFHRPEHTTTYTREGVGPNGERFHITVNETTTTLPMQQPHHHHHAGQHSNPALDVQAILRNADRFMATQGTQNNMQRSASNPTPAQGGSSTSNPTIARPETPSTVVNHAATNSSPLASTIPIPPFSTSARAVSPNPSPSNLGEATVYILSSPSGPRALLVNNGEAFYTPRQSRRHSPAGAQGQVIRAPVGLPEFRNRPAGRAARRNQRPPHVNAHANPGAGALAAQIGPMLWLVVRLVGFVWFFTAGNPSWTRWLMVSGLAFMVFLFNTGIFNGAAEQVWGPIRRHLEGLIPLGPLPAPPARDGPAEAAREGPDPIPNEPAARRRQPEPDPAEVAARLLEQRRQADRGWLMAQFRRAEHALLLFLASLVPGVGERHIAAREMEANAAEAERQRIIQAAEAVDATENAAENTENTENSREAAVAAVENAGQVRENRETQQDNAAPVQPLIEV